MFYEGSFISRGCIGFAFCVRVSVRPGPGVCPAYPFPLPAYPEWFTFLVPAYPDCPEKAAVILMFVN